MSRLNDHFGALCRLSAGGNAVVSWYNSFSDPSARLAQIAQTHDGGILIWLMGLAGFAIILDVLMNDWTPDRIMLGNRSFKIVWRKAFEFRHFLFLVLAFCYAAQPFVAEMGGHAISLFVYFFWHAIFNITVAFFDVRQRSRSIGWRRTCN